VTNGKNEMLQMKRHLPFALVLFGVISTFAALPSVPGTNEVIRYECDALYELGAGNDDFKTIPRDRGDALLSALGGGQQLEEIHYPPGMEVIPAPPRYWLNLILTNGSTNTFGIGDGFVVLPNGYYRVSDVARKQIGKVNDAFDSDARKEKETLQKQLVSEPKPLVYTVGSVVDGGTLSGIAKMFYGDANKWKMIYEANRQTIKNPDKITDGMKLTIPKLQ